MMKTSIFLTFLAMSSWAIAQDTFMALPDKAPVPKNNPMTKEKIELGKILFFDPRISESGTISCNSCHNVMAGGDDARATSIGHGGQKGKRSAPTVWNSAFLTVQFWDGRSPDLEDQARGPITNPIEMGMKSHDVALERIRQIPGYKKYFEAAFPKDKSPMNIQNAVNAIAAYERTLITPGSKFDQYMKGNKKAMNAQEIRGMKTVETVGCTACHFGPNFSGPLPPEKEGNYQKFPQNPNPEIVKKYNLSEDLGRYEVTKKEEDKNVYRVPTWRNVALTAPYFHNGSVKTLEEAVRVMGKLQLDVDLTSNQVEDIVAFLNTLTGPFPAQTMPRLPELRGRTLVED
ncbi:cytochrome-c peroxidase [Peredibacter starrii]|uniref:Cytochrome-c peroxidase n=1 Tax=Peredibacter starrii TaxID=28202 RepID=A0AAX4HUE9_9BACT|nr:cytochrome-c peroxidase [Peredibacter starrii]WPU66585.1 cytochrome-c peroxidase [Peredibacter starrii]